MKRILIGLFILIIFSSFTNCSTTTVTVKIEPSKHNFGQINIGTTATFDFVIKNNKTSDVTITSITFTTAEFKESGATLVGSIIVGKGTKILTIEFAPALPDGLKTDNVQIEWSDVNQKTGTLKIDLSGEAVASSKIEVAPDTYNFGTVLVGMNASTNFTIQNTGTADLIISTFNFNGNATSFSITAGGNTPITVNVGATHNFTVQFAPTIGGQLNTTLEISHNGTNTATPVIINISAVGTTAAPEISVNQTSPWNFGNVSSLSPKTENIEISNTGNADLTISSITLMTGTVFQVLGIEDSNGNPVNLPQIITQGSHIKASVTFSPTATTNYQDTLSIVHDGVNVASPLTVEIEGIGHAITIVTFNHTGALQSWTVPSGVTSIEVEVWGAQGGDGQGGRAAGKGAYIKGTLTVTPGSTLSIVAGGRGGTGTYSIAGGGGGGGSFVYNVNTPLIIAGGGGGGSYSGAGLGQDGTATINATAGGFSSVPPTLPGEGGYTDNGGGGGCGGGGGGWNSAGRNNSWCTGGAAKGGAGGTGPSGNYQNGGIGGGGGAMHGGGGGGGYTGGNGGSYTVGGGGAGSYNSGSSPTATAGIRQGHGEVKITY